MQGRPCRYAFTSCEGGGIVPGIVPQVPGVSGGIQSQGRAALEPAHPSAEQRAGPEPTTAQRQTARQLPGSCRNTTASGTQTAGPTPFLGAGVGSEPAARKLAPSQERPPTPRRSAQGKRGCRASALSTRKPGEVAEGSGVLTTPRGRGVPSEATACGAAPLSSSASL